VVIRTLFLVMLFLCGCAAAIPVMMVGHEADEARKRDQWVVFNLPHDQLEIWRAAYAVCEEQGHKIKSFDRDNGQIETDWKTGKYTPSTVPPDFETKWRRYGVPIARGNPKWTGIRYKYKIIVVQLTDQKSRIQIKARIDGFCYKGSRIPSWWNSNGTLEEILFGHIQNKLTHVSSPSR